MNADDQSASHPPGGHPPEPSEPSDPADSVDPADSTGMPGSCGVPEANGPTHLAPSDPGALVLSTDEREAFVRDGWIVIRNLLTPAECDELERVTMALLRRDIAVPGRDYCDMTSDYGRPIEDFSILNVMLPRAYHPPLRGNAYERRAAAVAAQLCGPDMALDYDQIVAKPPRRSDAVFHWHQDQAYWPATADTRTASFWLALDEVDEDNGCVCFVDGSHREPALRPHLPLHGDRSLNHTLVATLDPARDRPRPARLHRGDVSVHHERTLHGSGGNTSDRWRRGFVVAFRAASAVAKERALGFTHSHNDAPDVLRRVAALRDRTAGRDHTAGGDHTAGRDRTA